jgi:hypothetical protein
MNTDTQVEQWLKDLAKAKYPLQKGYEEFGWLKNINHVQREKRQAFISGVQWAMANREKEAEDLKEEIKLKDEAISDLCDELNKKGDEVMELLANREKDIGDAWDACEESMSANMKAVFMNNIWMADWNDAQVDKDKTSYINKI